MVVMYVLLYLIGSPLFYHSTGIGSCQTNLSCGLVCLSDELNCSCELTNSFFLTWTLTDFNNTPVGLGAAFSGISDNPGITETFAEELFIAKLTSVEGMTISSTATGIVNQTTDGYSLQCLDANLVTQGMKEISIPGKSLNQAKYFINILDKIMLTLCSTYR